jgi:hypothetical protein
MRLRPANATITDIDKNTYSVSFYVEGETNVATGSAADGDLKLFSILGIQWNDMTKSGFKAGDLQNIQLLTVNDGCNSFGSVCASSIVQTASKSSASGPSADALVYNKAKSRLDIGTDSASDAWGAATFYCGDKNLKISDLSAKDIKIVYTFKKSASSDPNNWYDVLSGHTAAFYLGGNTITSSTNIFWSPMPADVKNQYVTFTEKTQSLNGYGKSSKGEVCTPGSDQLGTSDALSSIGQGIDGGFPSGGTYSDHWYTKCTTTFTFPAYNCRVCGKGCPTGQCDSVDGGCSVAWAGAVSLKFPAKHFVCCGSDAGSAAWQEGVACTTGEKQARYDCDRSQTCAQKCDAAGYGSPVFFECDQWSGQTVDCDVCSCNSPKPA